MKILHTSDWHIGRSLYGYKRYDEFEAFLKWLIETIQKEAAEVLLVAGDVFDSSTPSNKAQELYYQFLCHAAQSCCRHIVIIGGNHDSPSFLNAPKELLRFFNVHVVGAAASPEDEVFVLNDVDDKPAVIVCAIPYLRDRDIRTIEAGESITDKHRKIVDGIRQHYAAVCQIARQKQASFECHVPIIAMGHLFTTGGQTMDGDGVRELYVGSLAHVGKDIFPDYIDYLALGHLHIPQIVGKSEMVRFSGSPLPMGFNEAAQQKSVVVLTFDEAQPTVREIAVPCFQALERISGNLEDICGRIEQLITADSDAWLEIEYSGESVSGNLRDVLEEAVAGSMLSIRCVRNKRIIERVMQQTVSEETLADLNENDVFNRLLDAHDVPEEQRETLILAYNEVLTELAEADRNAE